MPTLKIPDAFVPGIQKLAALDGDQIVKITDALNTAVPKLSASDLAAEVGQNFTQLSKADLDDMLVSLISLAGLLLGNESATLDQIIADVVATMQKEPERFVTPLIGWERFSESLKRILSADGLRISSRAVDVQQEFANIFAGARILSDLRTVFDDGETDAPRGVLIVHNLKVTYYSNGEYREVFLAMDNADIKLLRRVLDRAEQKTVALKQMIKNTAITYYQAE